jgi:hypothetical protein
MFKNNIKTTSEILSASIFLNVKLFSEKTKVTLTFRHLISKIWHIFARGILFADIFFELTMLNF